MHTHICRHTTKRALPDIRWLDFPGSAT